VTGTGSAGVAGGSEKLNDGAVDGVDCENENENVDGSGGCGAGAVAASAVRPTSADGAMAVDDGVADTGGSGGAAARAAAGVDDVTGGSAKAKDSGAGAGDASDAAATAPPAPAVFAFNTDAAAAAIDASVNDGCVDGGSRLIGVASTPPNCTGVMSTRPPRGPAVDAGVTSSVPVRGAVRPRFAVRDVASSSAGRSASRMSFATAVLLLPCTPATRTDGSPGDTDAVGTCGVPRSNDAGMKVDVDGADADADADADARTPVSAYAANCCCSADADVDADGVLTIDGGGRMPAGRYALSPDAGPTTEAGPMMVGTAATP
jgi:hypothetical protein